jgi:hypothetical protein
MSNNIVKTTHAGSAEFHRLLNDQPIAAMGWLQESYGVVDRGYREALRVHLLCAYEFASKAKEDTDVWNSFSQEQTYLADNPAKLLRAVMCNLMRVASHQDARYGRALNYARGLQEFFDRDAPSEEVRQALKKEGIERLYRATLEPAEPPREANQQRLRKMEDASPSHQSQRTGDESDTSSCTEDEFETSSATDDAVGNEDEADDATPSRRAPPAESEWRQMVDVTRAAYNLLDSDQTLLMIPVTVEQLEFARSGKVWITLQPESDRSGQFVPVKVLELWTEDDQENKAA